MKAADTLPEPCPVNGMWRIGLFSQVGRLFQDVSSTLRERVATSLPIRQGGWVAHTRAATAGSGEMDLLLGRGPTGTGTTGVGRTVASAARASATSTIFTST